jgi:DNA mismatch repair protein MutH
MRCSKCKQEGHNIRSCKNNIIISVPKKCTKITIKPIMPQTIADIHEKLLPIIGKEFTLPKTKNKGLPGLFLEECLGIPHTSNCLDCNDGELKLFPVKKLKKGDIVPKETIAVTMLSTEDLKNCEFAESNCYKKLNKMLVVPYYRTGDIIRFLPPKIIERTSPEFANIYTIIDTDYKLIRANYIKSGRLESKIGTFLQTRTKGTGHGSTSRAFYLRPEFMKQCFTFTL